MFVSPLEGHLSPAKTALADRLQWARSSIRKKLDMGGQQDSPKSATPKAKEEEPVKIDVKPQEQVAVVESQALSNGVPHHEDKKDCVTPPLINGNIEETVEISETTVQPGPVPSPERHTITHGDPLGALDVRAEIAKPAPVTSPEPKTPAKPFILPDLSVRLFAKSSSSSSSDSSSEDSSSDDDSSEDSESEEESDHSHDNVSSSASRLSFR